MQERQGDWASSAPRNRFSKHYTAENIRLLVETDTCHDILSGPATKKILKKGGSEPALELFKKFRGRKPKIDALLKQNEIKK